MTRSRTSGLILALAVCGAAFLVAAPVTEPEGLDWRGPAPELPEATDAPLPSGATARLGHPIATVHCRAFSPDGRLFATTHDSHWPGRGTRDRIHLWDARTGQHLRATDGHTGGVLCVAFSPDGSVFASGGTDKMLRVWDVRRGLQLGEAKDNHHYVYGVFFTPDGKRLISVSSEVWFWEAERFRELPRPRIGMGSSYCESALSPDGTVLATGTEKALCLWDLATGKELHTIPERIVPHLQRLTFSADGKTVVTMNIADGSLKRWDVKTGRALEDVGPKSKHAWKGAVFSPDGTTMVRSRLGTPDSDQACNLDVVDVDTGKERCRIPWPSAEVSLCLSADNKILAIGGSDGSLQFRDTTTGRLTRTLLEAPRPAVLLRYPVGAPGLLALTADGSLHEWDVARRRERRRCRLPLPEKDFLLHLSADGRTLLTADKKATLRVWDATTGRQRGEVRERPWVEPEDPNLDTHPRWTPRPDPDTIAPNVHVTASADGRLVAAAVGDGSRVTVCDADGTKRATARLGSVVRAMALSRTGVLYTADDTDARSATLRAWDPDANRELHRATLTALPPPKKPNDQVLSRVVALLPSPDEKHVAAVEKVVYVQQLRGGPERTAGWRVHLWDVGGKTAPRTANARGRIVAFTADGKYLAGVGEQGGVAVWQVSNAQNRGSSEHLNGITALTFTPDGRTLASAREDGTILLWDTSYLVDVRDAGK